MMTLFFYDTSLGKFGLAEANGKLTACYFASDSIPQTARQAELRETPLLREAHHQLNQYLNGQRSQFDLPLAPVGTKLREPRF